MGAEDGDGKEIRSAESLIFDLEILRAVTNNFSDANKIGQGGFEPFYKATPILILKNWHFYLEKCTNIEIQLD